MVKLAILILAAAALIYGAIAGGTADVLTKAVNICTECIGLG
ncbi:MAG: thioredoxin [Ruminococcaceae bacterium]|nr:thioredoxin [Oscillospiraceae bacterium]